MKSNELHYSLAHKLKISPGIIAGRFQRLTKKWNYFNGLKRKFQWAGGNAGRQ
jgi:hypothetical protein